VSKLTALGSKEAEMKIIGCDLHAAQQTIAMLDRETGEVVEKTLKHEADTVREFYAALPAPVVVGLEATGSMGWFLQLLDELEITYRVGHPATIRKAETRRQKHDRRDAALLLQLLTENRFPAIWIPSTELRDLRALLLHRHQWVRLRTRVQNALHAIALGYGVQRGHALWNRDGQLLKRGHRAKESHQQPAVVGCGLSHFNLQTVRVKLHWSQSGHRSRLRSPACRSVLNMYLLTCNARLGTS
jgi:transposase